jgi:hypothetical protein
MLEMHVNELLSGEMLWGLSEIAKLNNVTKSQTRQRNDFSVSLSSLGPTLGHPWWVRLLDSCQHETTQTTRFGS